VKIFRRSVLLRCKLDFVDHRELWVDALAVSCCISYPMVGFLGLWKVPDECAAALIQPQ
jgi:hypothetical protein